MWTAGSILFDMDGVLVDSMPVITKLLGRWADLHGLDRELVLTTAHGRREEELVRALVPDADVASEIDTMQRWQREEFDGCVACPGALDILSGLEPHEWAVVTSGSREVAAGRLGAAGIPIPQVLVCAEDVERGKPDPQPYLLAADLLGRAPAECVVIEDAPSGVASGLAAAMRVIAVNGMTGSWFQDAHLNIDSLAEIVISRTPHLSISTSGTC